METVSVSRPDRSSFPGSSPLRDPRSTTVSPPTITSAMPSPWL